MHYPAEDVVVWDIGVLLYKQKALRETPHRDILHLERLMRHLVDYSRAIGEKIDGVKGHACSFCNGGGGTFRCTCCLLDLHSECAGKLCEVGGGCCARKPRASQLFPS